MMELAEKIHNLTEEILDFIVDANYLKSVIVLHLFNVVTRIQHVVAPLLTRQHSTPYLLQCLADIDVALLAVRRNLAVWNDGRSKPLRTMITGRSMTKELKEDRDYLIAKHVVLLRAVQLVTQVKGYNIITPTSTMWQRDENKSVQSLKMRMKRMDTDQVSIFEADQYWRSYFGDELAFADSEEFCQILSLWIGETLNDLSSKRLLLRLDEADSGSISYSTFQDFVRQGNVRETVNLYSSDPPLPLLVWIDDDISAIIPKVMEVAELGITVFQFTSSTAAKAWVAVNQDFLKKNCDSGRIRFVVNQILYERNDYNLFSNNDNAGYQVTSFIRSRGIKSPILVYTSKQYLHLTKYVEAYDMVGSLCGNYLVFQAYVAALAGGRKDDTRWMRYNA